MTFWRDLVVLEHEPEDRDERDRQRKEGEENAVSDRRRVLRAAIAEHVLDRAWKRANDSAHHPAEVLEWPADEASEAPGLGGWCLAHRPESTETIRRGVRGGSAQSTP